MSGLESLWFTWGFSLRITKCGRTYSYPWRQAVQEGEFVSALLSSVFIHIGMILHYSHRDVSLYRSSWLPQTSPLVVLGHSTSLRGLLLKGREIALNWSWIMFWDWERPNFILPEIKGYLKIKDYIGKKEKRNQGSYWVRKGYGSQNYIRKMILKPSKLLFFLLFHVCCHLSNYLGSSTITCWEPSL